MKIKELSKYVRSVLLLAVLGVCCLVGSAQVPAAPNPARLVNDRADLFTPAQSRVLEDSLVAFARTTSTQIAVVTLADLGNYTPSEMAFAIMDQWGVGQKGKNNGIVLLIKPRNAHGRGEVFIATGLGLEGVLPDGKVTRVIDRQMMPYLKAGNYFSAADAGCTALRAITRGEYTADSKAEDGELIAFGVAILVLVLVVVGVVAADKKNRKNGGPNDSSDGGRGGGGDALTWLILGSLLGGGRGPRSGGGFGGGGGGGFGGFGGGGSFGGGGGRSF